MFVNDVIRIVVDIFLFISEGVCLISEGDILVIMVDLEVENVIGLVKMFFMWGKVKRKYEYDSSGERFFKLFFRVV